jgi:hypothetical protein
MCGSVGDSAPNTRDLWYSVAWKVDSGFCQNLLGAGFMAGTTAEGRYAGRPPEPTACR